MGYGFKKVHDSSRIARRSAIQCEIFFNCLAPEAVIGHDGFSTYGRLTEPRRWSSAPIL